MWTALTRTSRIKGLNLNEHKTAIGNALDFIRKRFWPAKPTATNIVPIAKKIRFG